MYTYGPLVTVNSALFLLFAKENVLTHTVAIIVLILIFILCIVIGDIYISIQANKTLFE